MALKRGPGNPNWRKGVTTNPGGRPKLAKGFAAWCRDQFEAPEGRALLQKRLKKSDYLLIKLLGYAYGEPQQQVEHSGKVAVHFVNNWRDGDR